MIILLILIINLQIITTLEVPYYYNPKIHNLGNIGARGKIHANLFYYTTKLVDNVRYDGRDIRKEIYSKYKNENILDLCCGIGMSTAENGIGIDTSLEMLNKAKSIKKKAKFFYGNAESYTPKIDIDIVTCMFAFHEMPLMAQINVINNGLRIARKEFIIVDIASNFKNKKPSKLFLRGEPYLIDYLNNIDYLTRNFEKINYIPNNVDVWIYKKSKGKKIENSVYAKYL